MASQASMTGSNFVMSSSCTQLCPAVPWQAPQALQYRQSFSRIVKTTTRWSFRSSAKILVMTSELPCALGLALTSKIVFMMYPFCLLVNFMTV